MSTAPEAVNMLNTIMSGLGMPSIESQILNMIPRPIVLPRVEPGTDPSLLQEYTVTPIQSKRALRRNSKKNARIQSR